MNLQIISFPRQEQVLLQLIKLLIIVSVCSKCFFFCQGA